MKNNRANSGQPPLTKGEFHAASERIAQHPFLQLLKQEDVSDIAWATYLGPRLKTMPGKFIAFFEAIEQTAKAAELNDLAKAARANINDELGIKRGHAEPSLKHATWRQWSQEGTAAILKSRGKIRELELLDEELPELDVYNQTLQTFIDTQNPYMLAGAGAGLEEIIRAEYSVILPALQKRFSELTEQQLLYFVEHADHDEGHFNALFNPLAKACGTNNDRLSLVRFGLFTIENTKDLTLNVMMTATRERLEVILGS